MSELKPEDKKQSDIIRGAIVVDLSHSMIVEAEEYLDRLESAYTRAPQPDKGELVEYLKKERQILCESYARPGDDYLPPEIVKEIDQINGFIAALQSPQDGEPLSERLQKVKQRLDVIAYPGDGAAEESAQFILQTIADLEAVTQDSNRVSISRECAEHLVQYFEGTYTGTEFRARAIAPLEQALSQSDKVG